LLIQVFTEDISTLGAVQNWGELERLEKLSVVIPVNKKNDTLLSIMSAVGAAPTSE
jgi:hypothetical protein